MRLGHGHPAPSLEEASPIYRARWDQMIIHPHMIPALEQMAVRLLINGKDRYASIERVTGVPIAVIAGIHERESSGNFHAWLHNGDPMRNSHREPIQTHHVPAGRPRNPNVTWEAGGVDALTLSGMVGQEPWTIEKAAYFHERFNGWGYWMFHHECPAPYLWSWTSIYTSGKYIADGKFSYAAIDHQVGTMALIKVMWGIDPTTVFGEAGV